MTIRSIIGNIGAFFRSFEPRSWIGLTRWPRLRLPYAFRRTQPVLIATRNSGVSAAELDRRGWEKPPREKSQRSGHARFTKWHLDREHRNKVQRISGASRARNRGL